MLILCKKKLRKNKPNKQPNKQPIKLNKNNQIKK